MEKLLLVKWNDNWADEMDLDGFAVTTEKNWEFFKEIVHKYFNAHHPAPEKKTVTYSWGQVEDTGLSEQGNPNPYIHAGFGTNEHNEYTSAEDFLRNYSSTEISEGEADTLFKLFGGKYDSDKKQWEEDRHFHYGMIPYMTYPQDIIEITCDHPEFAEYWPKDDNEEII